jgi:hypothetical protein
MPTCGKIFRVLQIERVNHGSGLKRHVRRPVGPQISPGWSPSPIAVGSRATRKLGGSGVTWPVKRADGALGCCSETPGQKEGNPMF